jgi:hypothetical protein
VHLDRITTFFMLADIQMPGNMNFNFGEDRCRKIDPRTASVVVFNSRGSTDPNLPSHCVHSLAKINILKVHPEVLIESADIKEDFSPD